MKTKNALADYLAGREFCADCGGTRFRYRMLLKGLLGIAVCQNPKCKAEGRAHTINIPARCVVRGMGGRWELNKEEERAERACRAIRNVIRRLGK